MSEKKTYLGKIAETAKSVAKGLSLSGKHMRKGHQVNEPLGIEHPDYFKQVSGPITIQYPQAKVPVPDNGRYRLHMETDDCIGCDKCARICPVDCITIETFRADGDLGRTSDGTIKRLHLPVFDIDMGKCMYCGLCTTVCPTECLTMTKVYDYSEYDRDNLVYHFGAYSPEEETTIRVETEAALAAKKAEKAKAAGKEGARPRPLARKKPVRKTGEGDEVAQPAPKPRPIAKPAPMAKPSEAEEQPQEDAETKSPPKRRTRPLMKRKPAEEDQGADLEEKKDFDEAPAENPAPKKRARPLMKRKPAEDADSKPKEGGEEG